MGVVIQVNSAKVEFWHILVIFKIIVTFVELHYGNNQDIKIVKTICSIITTHQNSKAMTLPCVVCQDHCKRFYSKIIEWYMIINCNLKYQLNYSQEKILNAMEYEK